jgi:polar amino acid transport system ATP-binding protein/sulfate transport system ATP-binding protein
MTLSVEYRDVVLSVDHVSLTLGETQVLRDVSLQVRDLVRPGCVTGQVVGLLGPSGVGKTQLFRVLAGLQPPTRGAVKVDVEQQAVRAGMVGVVAQDYPLFEHRTVLGNLLVASHRPAQEAQGQAARLLERFGLTAQAGLFPGQLSGGQRQRAAIAQQFMCSEHLLLMDEPFSGLDPLASAAVRELIAEVASQDTLNTILLTTHDIAAAVEVCDHLWLLGRDRDSQGRALPGARVQQTIDLVERGLAWRKDAASTPEFHQLVWEIRERFKTL